MTGTGEVGAGQRRRISMTVNGQAHTVEVETRMLLADLLRHELGLTGTHVGCEQGACGACTVLVDGDPVRSCLVLAPQIESRTVETVEWVALDHAGRGERTDASELHPFAAAMAANHGLQCGFCTPGIVVSLVAAHRRGASLEEALADVLDGHLCRCTGYVNIRGAVRAAWSDLDGGLDADCAPVADRRDGGDS